jgi:hypothetical protein
MMRSWLPTGYLRSILFNKGPSSGDAVVCPLLAQSKTCTCLLWGVKQTWLFAAQMSAFDPKRTFVHMAGRLNLHHPILKTRLAFSERNKAFALSLSSRLDAGNALARRPERMVRAEQHSMGFVATHVVNKVLWISAHFVSGRVDEYVRIFHEKG